MLTQIQRKILIHFKVTIFSNSNAIEHEQKEENEHKEEKEEKMQHKKTEEIQQKSGGKSKYIGQRQLIVENKGNQNMNDK